LDRLSLGRRFLSGGVLKSSSLQAAQLLGGLFFQRSRRKPEKMLNRSVLGFV
jgi:hypothetical protein